MAKMYGKGKSAIESEEQQKLRWQVELEFVQCLANPNYLNFLAQRGYFKDQAFINYLKYLQYWKEPEYAKFLMYPLCLYFLDLLQYEHFRREIVNSQCCKFIDDQAILQWQHYTRKRIKLFNSVNPEIVTTEPPADSTPAGATAATPANGATVTNGLASNVPTVNLIPPPNPVPPTLPQMNGVTSNNLTPGPGPGPGPNPGSSVNMGVGVGLSGSTVGGGNGAVAIQKI